VLPLELALHLLSSRALALEGGLSLLESGLLLLKPSLRLLTHAPLLAELLLHHSERGGFLLQASTQPLGFLGFCLAWAYQDRAPSRVARSY
jgi:hypothetical protein